MCAYQLTQGRVEAWLHTELVGLLVAVLLVHLLHVEGAEHGCWTRVRLWVRA
jgi:hypothetical protein